MISFIRGKIAWITENTVVIDHQGIGYEVSVPASILMKQPRQGEEIFLYTYLQVREDGISLFGFESRDELKVFRMLIGVSGIGPKGAVGILSAVSVDNLRFAVLSEDEKTISKAPGIGTKTARKLILELKDKFKLEDAFGQNILPESGQIEETKNARQQMIYEAIQALTALGFSRTEASRAVNAVELSEEITADDLLKAALKKL